MQVILDCFGGDHCPQAAVEGAMLAIQKKDGFDIVLSGDEKKISPLLTNNERLTILHAPDVISNDDVPTDAVRNKPDSSLIAAIDYMNSHDEVKAFVSTGSTGAVLTASVLLIKRIRGINRPALAPVLPTVKENKKVILIDCGANVEPKAQNLLQFAMMGVAYAKALGQNDPVVGLLSNGTEDKKGNPLSKEAFLLLKDSGLNFAGNIEAREILSGDYDVVVSDGFSGNIALKACEGTAVSMFSLIKDGIMQGGLRAKIGYLLLKPVFKKIKHTMDYNDNGGAVLLGLNKIVVKGHGASKAKAVCNTILQAVDLAERQIVDRISTEITND